MQDNGKDVAQQLERFKRATQKYAYEFREGVFGILGAVSFIARNGRVVIAE